MLEWGYYLDFIKIIGEILLIFNVRVIMKLNL